MFSNLFLSISPQPPHLQPSSWSAHFPSLPSRLSPPCCSTCWVTVSSHSINQACEGSCAQCSIASHSHTVQDCSHQCPSVSSHSLSPCEGEKKGSRCQIRSVPALAGTSATPPPSARCRSGDGQDAAGVPDSAHLIWLDNSLLPLNGQDLPRPPLEAQHRSLGVRSNGWR